MNKTQTSISTAALLAVAVVLLVMPRPAQAQTGYSGLVVFGTSLSDPGNAFVLRGDAATPPDFQMNPLLIPSLPYAKGGHHFSNGATWVEQYARSVGLGDSVKAALATTDPVATNFAVGAARAYDDGSNFNLTLQVTTFLQRAGGVASPQALYVIEMGSNDIRDAFASYVSGGNGGLILTAAIRSIATNSQRLYVAGARNFLVWAPPNVGLTPAVRSLGPAAVAGITNVTLAFNAGLTGVLTQLEAALQGVTFTRLDAFAALNAIVAVPAAFGLTTVTTPCLTPNDAPFSCSDARDYLFWDGIHPTKAGHAILAQITGAVLP